ncbi:hypothetical protein LTR12_013861 [Friedmanniomyces endolithicus]|nr:hypothetical protein LTR12_013861 [Friedmanniomyces endolithicus]
MTPGPTVAPAYSESWSRPSSVSRRGDRSTSSTLDTLNNLDLFYHQQGKLAEARRMYLRAAEGYEHAEGDHEAQICHLREQLLFLRMDDASSQNPREDLTPSISHGSKVKNPLRKIGKRDRLLRLIQKRVKNVGSRLSKLNVLIQQITPSI